MTRRKGRKGRKEGKEGKEGKDDLLHSLVTFNFYYFVVCRWWVWCGAAGKKNNII